MKFFRVETESDARALADIMPQVIAMDTEYETGDPRTTKLLSVIIADEDKAWAVNPSLLPMLTPVIRARKLIFLQDYNRCDTIILLKHGCDLRDVNCYNLIDMHHILDENAEHGLGERVLVRYGDNYKSGFWGKYKNFSDAPEDEAFEYQCKDGIYTYRLGIEDYGKILHPLYDHIRNTSACLLDTQLNGLSVNIKLMEQTERELKVKIDSYLPKLRSEFNEYCTIWELKKWQKEIEKRSSYKGKSGVARPIFSFESDRQISELVYGETYLQLPVINKTKKGSPSTDYETLKELSKSHQEISTLVEYKSVKALYGTFVKGMLERVENGRIYPNFNVSGTSTGRLSHSNPNMANLPTEGVIRNFFLPDDECVLFGADYAQLEVVIEANLTGDKNLLKIINEGVSKHDITAQGLGIDRNSAKTLNFALQYGAGVEKIRRILNISPEAAEDVYQRYWELYSGVRTLKEKTVKELKEKGQVTNLFGRTRHFPKPKNKYDGFKQERQAYNFLIQGVAGDACNRAMWKFTEAGGKVLFSVHDEILAQCNPEEVESQKQLLCQVMEEVSAYLGFKYPLQSKSYGPLDFWCKA